MNDVNIHNSHKMINGQFVSTKVSQVVQAIHEHFDGEVEVKWVPPGARNEGEAAYALVHNPPGGQSIILMYVQKDEDFDERVLARLIANDQRYNPVTLSAYEAWEQANRLVEEQAWLDQLEVASDLTSHILGSPLNDYRVNSDLRIKDGIPFNVAHVDDKNRKQPEAPDFDLKELM